MLDFDSPVIAFTSARRKKLISSVSRELIQTSVRASLAVTGGGTIWGRIGFEFMQSPHVRRERAAMFRYALWRHALAIPDASLRALIRALTVDSLSDLLDRDVLSNEIFAQLYSEWEYCSL